MFLTCTKNPTAIPNPVIAMRKTSKIKKQKGVFVAISIESCNFFDFLGKPKKI